jgi:hypothetical protein
MALTDSSAANRVCSRPPASPLPEPCTAHSSKQLGFWLRYLRSRYVLATVEWQMLQPALQHNSLQPFGESPQQPKALPAQLLVVCTQLPRLQPAHGPQLL